MNLYFDGFGSRRPTRPLRRASFLFRFSLAVTRGRSSLALPTLWPPVIGPRAGRIYRNGHDFSLKVTACCWIFRIALCCCLGLYIRITVFIELSLLTVIRPKLRALGIRLIRRLLRPSRTRLPVLTYTSNYHAFV